MAYVITALVLLCLIGAAAVYYQKKILIPQREKEEKAAREEKDKRDTEKLQQILQADNPENPPLHVCCHTNNQSQFITVSAMNDKYIYEVRRIKELGESKCDVLICAKIKEIPDLAETNINGLVIAKGQDFAIHLDQLAAMPNIKSFSFDALPAKLTPPTRINGNMTSLAINFPEKGSFDLIILSWFPNLKSIVLVSLYETTEFTGIAAKLPEMLYLIVFFGKFKNYLNLLKMYPDVRQITFKEGDFDLAGLEESVPALIDLRFEDCTIVNAQVLQHLPQLAFVTFNGYSPQEVEKMTQSLPPKVKVTLGESRKTSLDIKK